jgi:hypothetical protein
VLPPPFQFVVSKFNEKEKEKRKTVVLDGWDGI